MKALKGILSEISFFTIIPSVKADIEVIAQYSFLSPLIIGLIASVVDFSFYYIFFHFLGRIGGILLIPVIEIFRGFNHLDGLLDIGDGLMVRDPQRRILAIKDVQVGSGGIGMALVYLSLMIVSLETMPSPSIYSFLNLIGAEISARGIGILVLSLYRPAEWSSIGKTFSSYLRRKYPYVILQVIPFILFYPLIAFFILTFLFILIARYIGGSTGDLAGAAITLSFPIMLLMERYCYLISLVH
ncbi:MULTISPECIES: adenosylcobinamide-GDP ribazoletransferase [Acidianus]|uniref:Adenosylcobinamide-GDP ribazoletransferase n=1 Tax=Candidatus Acidianus copahuensis TaxID=1160895 RepID=A0A031LTM7_9CREN|nr:MULTISPECIES: adenosylcobinamide-GDP ribazoletransferase [Acidianus]EZQ10864.1 cobalamin synthase [Candidatus Acidianus copahuensis]NON62008.1 adenosylcobinamide-GDP ribazoletransferase [Acidianus sp. RZ1]